MTHFEMLAVVSVTTLPFQRKKMHVGEHRIEMNRRTSSFYSFPKAPKEAMHKKYQPQISGHDAAAYG